MLELKTRILSVVSQDKIRNNGLGDYYEESGVRYIKTADVGNEVFHVAILLHEVIEELDTRFQGIDEELINKFDEEFEEERELGIHGKDDEPGNDPRCIYFEAHQFATRIEKQIIEHFGYTWEQYNKQLSGVINGKQ